MKYIYSLIFLVLISNSTLAQADLHVSSGSFVFVDGTGFTSAPNVAPLYVTDNINLESNGHIYLRNEAQLLQGGEVIGNSGEGELSVQQTGTVNQFAYNYWCSPIGNNSAAAGNEDFRVDLIDETTGLTSSVDALFTSDYNGIASPLTISNRWLYSFVSSDEYSEWIPLDETSPIRPGLGFTMKGNPSGSQVYDFRGKPNNGTILNPIVADQLTLIGNPYPSALDALLFIHDTDNANIDADAALSPAITGALYYWEQQPTDHFIANYIGGYAAYTISSGGDESFVPAVFSAYDGSGNIIPLPPPGADGGKVAQRYIPIGQGFMVEGASATIGESSVFVKNSMRVFEKESGGLSYFFRTAETDTNSATEEEIEYNEFGLNIVPDDFKRFRINVIFDNAYTRQLLQNFHHTASDGFDYGLEAPASGNSGTDAYWILGEEAYVIQAHKFEIEKRIPIIIRLEEQQSIDFRIFDIQNFDDSQPIYLHDIENNLYVDLRQQNYDLNLQQGIYDNRFEITFTNEDTLGNEVVTISGFIVFQDNNNAQLTIKNPNSLDVNSVSLFDVSGKQIFKVIDLDTQDSYQFSTKNMSDGIYVTVIGLDTNETISKKLVIKNN